MDGLYMNFIIPVGFNTNEDEIRVETYEDKMLQMLKSGIVNDVPDDDVTAGDEENVRQQILEVRQSDISHLKLARRAIEMALEKRMDDSDNKSDNRFVTFQMTENGSKARVLFPGNAKLALRFPGECIPQKKTKLKVHLYQCFSTAGPWTAFNGPPI